MKIYKLLEAIGNISEDYIEEAAPAHQPSCALAPKNSLQMRKLLALAAALVIIISAALVFALPRLASDTDNIGDIRGIEAYDYTWDAGNSTALRVAINELYDMFGYFNNNRFESAFAIVRVLDTQQLPPSEEWASGADRQSADVEVLYSVGDKIPDKIKLMQYLAGGYMNSELTNLVRKGGVYVLSLVRPVDPSANRKIEEYYYAFADLDALFEVDDAGLIHSHSMWKELKKYDGKPLEELWADIEYIYSHPVLFSDLVRLKLNQYNIIRGVVSELAPGEGKDGGDLYTVELKETLLGTAAGTQHLSIDPALSGNSPKLEIGGEYVFCFSDKSDDGYLGSINNAARIGKDGRLALPVESEGSEDTGDEALTRNNSFNFAIGLTVGQLKAQIAEVNGYYDEK